MWQQIAKDRQFTYEFTGEYHELHDSHDGGWYGMYWDFDNAGRFATVDGQFTMSKKSDYGYSNKWGTSIALNEAWLDTKIDSITVTLNGVSKILKRNTDWGKGWVTYGSGGDDVLNFKSTVGKKVIVKVSW